MESVREKEEAAAASKIVAIHTRDARGAEVWEDHHNEEHEAYDGVRHSTCTAVDISATWCA
jgi:hypothetical protein